MFENIEMPERVKKLSRDPRGFPIPYVILVDENGAHFKINDESKVQKALKYKLCAICGYGMKSGDMWLAGGPLSAFHPDGAFNDTPMHYECGKYALQVCPFLAAKGWKDSEIATINAIKKVADTSRAYVNPTQMPGLPICFGYVQISGFKVKTPQAGVRYVMPDKPYRSIEFWKNGERIDASIAVPLIRKAHPVIVAEF